MKRVVFYVRVSRSTDESVSLARQTAELQELADAEGWTVVGTFSDDGVSGRVARAQADAALDAIATGEADVLAVWELSRFSRMGLGAVAKLVTVIREKPGSLFVAKKEGLRSDQPAFGIMASVIAEVAAMEAEGTRDRIRSMRSHVLAQTKPEDQRWLGGQAPIGYRTVARPDGPGKMLVVDEFEAAHLREVARRLIAGQAMTEVTQYLIDQGVPTAQSPARKARQAGKPVEGLDAGSWRITTVSKIVRSQTLLGRTTREVEVGKRSDGSAIIESRVVSDAAGLPIQRWDPVLDVGTFTAMQAVLRVRGPNRVKKAASWLSGFLVCGLCGETLYATSRESRPSGSFRCVNRAIPGQACKGVSIQRARTEQYVEDAILRMIGDLEEYKVEQVGVGPDTAELDAVAQAIADMQGALVADGADYGQLLPQLDRLKADRQRILSDPGTVATIRVPTGRKLWNAWLESSIRERQFIIADMIDFIVVEPAAGGGAANRVEDRLLIKWSEYPEVED